MYTKAAAGYHEITILSRPSTVRTTETPERVAKTCDMVTENWGRKRNIRDKTQGCTIDFWRAVIRQQFHAAIDMLANAINACPDSVWPGEGRGAFWYLAFHVLFFLDMYLSPEDEVRFRPPAPFGRGELEEEVVLPERAYRKDELLGYLEHCRKKLDGVMAGMTEEWTVSPCPFAVSRDEQRRTAPLQHAARATSRGATEHAAASEDKFGAAMGVEGRAEDPGVKVRVESRGLRVESSKLKVEGQDPRPCKHRKNAAPRTSKRGPSSRKGGPPTLVHHGNLLIARVKITSYNQHCSAPFFRALVVYTYQVYSEKEPTTSSNQAQPSVVFSQSVSNNDVRIRCEYEIDRERRGCTPSTRSALGHGTNADTWVHDHKHGRRRKKHRIHLISKEATIRLK